MPPATMAKARLRSRSAARAGRTRSSFAMKNGEQVGDAVTVSGECQPTPQLPATINPPMSPIAIFTELAPGSYTIKATGENGCTAYSDQFTIKAPEFGLSLTTVDAKCNGLASGSASIEVCGENGPYSVVLCDEDGLPMGSATELSGDCLGRFGRGSNQFWRRNL